MSSHDSAPRTLIEAVRYFADEDVALAFAANLRWPDGKQVCPKCGDVDTHYFLKTRRKWKCRSCRKQFSIKVGTIFEDSPISLSKWLPALWMLANCKNGISSYELGRALGVTQKTAWFMLHRIRLAMSSRTFKKLHGEVEVDETFIGGKAKNMHASKRRERITSRGGIDKTAVVGFIRRPIEDGEKSTVRAKVTRNARARTVQDIVRSEVEPGTDIYTDGFGAYRALRHDYRHGTVAHDAAQYVLGRIHTNGIENFWSLLKRAIKGTYVAVEPFHLFRYVDEQSFRFNMREDDDCGRFLKTLASVIRRRLTYAELTGAKGVVA